MIQTFIHAARPLAGVAFLAAATLTACGPGAPPESDDPAQSAAPADPAERIRTADPYARGYTDDDFPRLRQLADGVYSYEQLRSAGEERFTTVSLIVVTDEGVLIGDGQGSVEETRLLVEHVGRLTDRPITHVVIGSDHGDHTAGNSALPADARYFAHPTSAAVLAASAASPNRAADAPPVRLATDLVPDRTVLELGGRTVEILFLGRAHTGGDLMVHLPEEKILFMSEAYLHRVFPAMRSAFPTEWVAMIERAQAMDVDVYVPGHGFVDAPDILESELEVFRRALVSVIEEGSRLHAAGIPLEEAQNQASFGDLESWSLRSSQGSVAIRQVYAELNGELPGGDR